MFFVLVYWLINLLILLIFISSVLSWFRPDPRNPLVRGVNAVVDPLLHPLRAILPTGAGLDFSPMAAIFLLYLLRNLLQRGLAL